MKKQKMTVAIIMMLLTISICLVASYALWTFSKSQTDENRLIAACLKLELTNQTPKISLENAWPKTDFEAIQIPGYTFRVQNECPEPVEYQINLNSKTISGEGVEYLSNASIGTLLDFGAIKTYDSFPSQTTTEEDVRDSKVLGMDTVLGNSYNDHNLKIWIDSETPVSEQQKQFQASISVIAGQGIAIDYTAEDHFAFNSETQTIESYDSETYNDTNIVVPRTIGGVEVKRIGEGAFSGAGVENVIIPRGVTSIGSGAFSGCMSLTNVTLPTGLLSLEDAVFAGITLPQIMLPNTLETIGSATFNGASIEFFDIPNSVTSIGEAAFNGNSALTNFKFGSGITSIGASEFSGTNLTEVTIPGNILTIGTSAFQDTPLELLVIEEGVQTIGDYAFNGTKFAHLNIPNSVTTIGDNAFQRSSSSENLITRLNLGTGLTTIGNYAFQHALSPQAITIPNSVTNIGLSAFESNGTVNINVDNTSSAASSWPSSWYGTNPVHYAR